MSVLKSWGIKLKKEPKIEIIWCCPILCGDHACIQIIILEVTCFELFNEYVFQLAAASTIKIAWSPTLVVYSDRLLFNPLFMLSACLCRCLPLDYLPLTFLSSVCNFYKSDVSFNVVIFGLSFLLFHQLFLSTASTRHLYLIVMASMNSVYSVLLYVQIINSAFYLFIFHVSGHKVVLSMFI